jgi:uncharacterized short protein YbdD (DUF466 family)
MRVVLIVLGFMFTSFLQRQVSRVCGRVDGRPSPATARNQAAQLQDSLELGARIAAILKASLGDEAYEEYVANVRADCPGRVPRMFWREFVESELRLRYTDKERVRCSRALRIYVERSAGTPSYTVMRAGQRCDAKRRDGGSKNNAKARGLGWSLLQFFTDQIQVLKCRSDSGILLREAMGLRSDLVDAGWTEDQLPTLTGGAGRSWLMRWRHSFGITMKSAGMQLKVSYSTVYVGEGNPPR